MRKCAYVTALIAMVAVASGCSTNKSKSMASFTPDYGSVDVRFVVPPMPENTDSNLATTGSTHVNEAGYTGFVPVAGTDPETMSHVALWGNGFNGHDVTYADTALQPGIYTFAYLKPDQDKAVQGWVDVNPGGTDMIDFLNRWYENIPQMRQSLAFELEMAGGTKMANPSVFEGFAKQLAAFDHLESQLGDAIQEEKQAEAEAANRYNEYLRSAHILLLPSKTEFFQPTTQPTFTDAELASVEAGTPMNKIVMLADADNSTWKLNRINSVYSELNRCKTVLMAEADRLQRRKRFYTLTDHLYNYDKLFVSNELRLQQTLSAIDTVNDQINELRQRRMALAFVNELVAPDGQFRTLDNEASDLNREKTVLQASQAQINQLFNEAKENSAKRVILERKRQEVNHGIEQIDQQLAQIDQARVALGQMKTGTQVINRQGNWRLMTASLSPDNIPYAVRRAVEQEALMTVRLEPTDTMFIPSNTKMTAMPPLVFPEYTTYTYHNDNGHVQLVKETNHGWTTYDGMSTTTHTYGDNDKTTTVSYHGDGHQTSHNGSTSSNSTTMQKTSYQEKTSSHAKHSNQNDDGSKCHIPGLLKIFVPPCWGK